MKASVEDRIIEGLEEFTKALKSGKALTEKFNVRRVVLDLKPKSFTPEMVKKTRGLLSASQAVFALFLGVSVKTVQAWEQGLLSPNRIACRFMEEILKNPEVYQRRFREIIIQR
jgi:putative transcriptional regulator